MATTYPYRPLLPASSCFLSVPESSLGCIGIPQWAPSIMPAPCPTDRFLDAQLGDLRALQRREQQIIRRLQRRLSACQAGLIPIDVLAAPVLVHLLHDTQDLEAYTAKVLTLHRQALQQVHRSRHCLSTGGKPA